MADEDTKLESGQVPGDPPGGEVPPDDKPPEGEEGKQTPENYASAEEFRALRDQFSGLKDSIDTLAQGMSAIAASNARAAVPTAAPLPELSDEQIRKVFQENEGDPVTVIRTLERRLEQKTAAAIDQLRAQGETAIAGVSKRVATSEMPHYARFRKEIDGFIDQLAPDAKTNPETLTMAHDLVVGRHYEELAKEKVAEALRKSRETAPAPDAPAGGSSGKNTEGKPDATVIFGSDALASLTGAGRTLDDLARSLGYESGEEYLAFAKKQQEGNA